MPFNPQLKRKLFESMKRDISILRQMLYKELQAWKRQGGDDSDMPILGQMILTDEEKKAIDALIPWFLVEDMEDISDELAESKAKNTLKDLEAVTMPTAAQDNYRKALEDALTLDSKDEPF